ncbi:TPA: flavodoxin family protein [Legionella pneumophila]
MTQISVIYYSGFGHTEVLARSVVEGVSLVRDVDVACLHVDSLSNDLSELDNSDAIIFGSPTYMGSVAAPFKHFMDSTSKIWFSQSWKNKVAAGFTNGQSLSGDKLNTLIQMIVFATQHSMIWVGQSEMNQSPKNEAGKLDVLNRLGSNLGAMAQSEDDSPLLTPPLGDILTAKKLGERVAGITKLIQHKAINL